MKTNLILITILLASGWYLPAMGAEGHSGHGDKSKTAMEHHDMTAKQGAPDTFKHETVVDGIKAEFEIMSLASMNMKDENGATHHVMLKLSDSEGNAIDKAKGKIKLIAPSGQEQSSALKNYNGIFAANFAFGEEGKYGVICLFKQNGSKHLVKFWYPHEGGM